MFELKGSLDRMRSLTDLEKRMTRLPFGGEYNLAHSLRPSAWISIAAIVHSSVYTTQKPCQTRLPMIV